LCASTVKSNGEFQNRHGNVIFFIIKRASEPQRRR
jgi:hypothetical protein